MYISVVELREKWDQITAAWQRLPKESLLALLMHKDNLIYPSLDNCYGCPRLVLASPHLQVKLHNYSSCISGLPYYRCYVHWLPSHFVLLLLLSQRLRPLPVAFLFPLNAAAAADARNAANGVERSKICILGEAILCFSVRRQQSGNWAINLCPDIIPPSFTFYWALTPTHPVVNW